MMGTCQAPDAQKVTVRVCKDPKLHSDRLKMLSARTSPTNIRFSVLLGKQYGAVPKPSTCGIKSQQVSLDI